MSYNRADVILEVRDAFYEASANLFTDAQIKRFINQEIRSLPTKDIYLEEIHTTSTVINQLDYVLPTGTLKVEKLEVNLGTSSQPDWQEVKGFDTYGGALYLDLRPAIVETMRVHLRKAFTIFSDETTASDVPDDKMEVVIWGTVVRAYRAVMGYLRDAKNWDAIAKPSGIQMAQVQAWYRDAKTEYNKLIEQYHTVPRPREINLVD